MLNPLAKAALKGLNGKGMSTIRLDGRHYLADRVRQPSESGSHIKQMVTGVRGIFQQPRFSVIVWVRKTDEFEAIRSHLINLVGDEPFESTEYEGMVDFHWGFGEHAKAKQIADSLREICKRSEIVVLRVSSLDDAIPSFSLKDERRTRH